MLEHFTDPTAFWPSTTLPEQVVAFEENLDVWTMSAQGVSTFNVATHCDGVRQVHRIPNSMSDFAIVSAALMRLRPLSVDRTARPLLERPGYLVAFMVGVVVVCIGIMVLVVALIGP